MPRKAKSSKQSSKKAGKARDESEDESEPPSPQIWAKMIKYGSFVVSDEDDEEHHFRQGDCGLILPHGLSPGTTIPRSDYWVGKILEIRAVENDDNTNEVWVQVQWYYSGKDVSGAIKSFKGEACGAFERTLSTSTDIVSSQAFEEVIQIANFVERDIDQKYIDRDEFYTRYTLGMKNRAIKPKQGLGTCICDTPYQPDSDTDIMHFCPRPSCQKAYHQQCLLNGKKEKGDADWGLRLLSSSPDTDNTVNLDESVSPPQKKRRGRPPKNTTEQTMMAVEKLALMPVDLVWIAQQPIVRGRAFELGGVSGNVFAVVRARRMVYEALAGKDVPQDWESVLSSGIGDWRIDYSIVELKKGSKLHPLLCPQCEGAI